MGANSGQYHCSDRDQSARIDSDIIHRAILGGLKKNHPDSQFAKRDKCSRCRFYGHRIDLIDKAVWNKLACLWIDDRIFQPAIFYQNKNPNRYYNRGCFGFDILA